MSPFHSTWNRRVVRSLQLEEILYLNDMPLICLNCDAVAIPFNNAVRSVP